MSQLEQLTGIPVPQWQPRPAPDLKLMKGKYCTLEPITLTHAPVLFEAYKTNPQLWTYLSYGPFATLAEFEIHLQGMIESRDPLHFTIVNNQTGRAVGTMALLRIVPEHGVMEVGHLVFSDAMKRSFMSTEAHYLLMRYAFDELGYRRYEWKCDSCNAPSRAAALRLGFTFEGTFRQHSIYRGRNRDTSWFSIIDSEWPAIRQAMESWLSDENGDETGRQKQKLSAFMSICKQTT